MQKQPQLKSETLQSICKTIADTNDGLTGSEIALLLGNSNIPDIDSANTKWKRLYNAFADWQNNNNCSNNVLDFLKRAMNPIGFLGKEHIFEDRRHEINKRLSFIGIEITERGTLTKIATSNTITEAEQRANRFKHKLGVRFVHSEIFKYCEPEIRDENYFHTVFESVKSVAERLRKMSNVYEDGAELADVVFSTKNPLVRINLLSNETQRSEHLGLMNIIKGLFGLIRNPTAHIPKYKFPISEEEALDILIVVSLVHKKLDLAL